MDIDKVRGLADNELRAELTTARRHLYDLRFQLATRQLTDYNQVPQTRKTIARILTVMTERQLTESTPSATPGRPRRRAAAGATR